MTCFWFFVSMHLYIYVRHISRSRLMLLYFPFHCSYCGIHDPSWSEVLHFVHFLDLQLRSCEESVYCDETIVGDVMSGLKSFVVKFMIRMSRVSVVNIVAGIWYCMWVSHTHAHTHTYGQTYAHMDTHAYTWTCTHGHPHTHTNTGFCYLLLRRSGFPWK